MSILKKIADSKTLRVAYAKGRVSQAELLGRIRDMDPARDFHKAVRRTDGPVRLIAEVKKASPSRGIIRQDFDPASIAAVYESKPVSAISVLTEEDFFQGQLAYLKIVKDIVSKPVLRKDFILDAYQIYEARAFGADAILLIAALLEDSRLREYLHMAAECGLHALLEVHDERELELAMKANAGIIGINNRNLKTMETDLGITLRLKKEIPDSVTVIGESGINNRADVRLLEDAGIDAVLIGTALMESQDIGAAIDRLLAT
jgi:indole-3-glycerol phosphate synthase